MRRVEDWSRPRRAVLARLRRDRESPRRSAVSGGRARRVAHWHLRGRHLLLLDLAGIFAGAYVALALRFDAITGPFAVPAFPAVVLLLLATRTAVNLKLDLYARRWRNASVADLERIGAAVAVGSLVTIVLFYGGCALAGPSGSVTLPRSFWPIEALLSISILGGLRFAIRAAAEHDRGSTGKTPRHASTTLLYGAGQTGALLARSAQRHPEAGVRPVGFLDDDASLHGGIVAGLRVFGGLASLGRAAAETGARTLLISMPRAPGSAVRRIVETASRLHLEVRTVPSVEDLLDGSVDAYRVRRVRVEDLLRRPMVTEHCAGVEELVRDRTVLITGGAGSIGSELARQVFGLGPRRLILVDRAESPLYLVLRELESRRSRGRGSGEIVGHLANVASRCEMERFIARQAPSVILHAAAYKHVPLMEAHPSDAVHVNIGGTMVLLDAALGAGVERFVLVSTDKAVRPSNVMGATKRIAEMLVAEAAHSSGRPYVSVRFGNVLGSNGSVVPIFRQQLENGEPLTITHPDMTRYFMTIPEAAWLILDAAAIGVDGDLFVLDMGEPIRVMDLARDLVRLAGHDPDSHPIETVGLRPGEKLNEELFYDIEQVQPTSSPKVLRARVAPPRMTLREDAFRLLRAADGADEPALRLALLDYVHAVDTAVPVSKSVPTPSRRNALSPRAELAPLPVAASR